MIIQGHLTRCPFFCVVIDSLTHIPHSFRRATCVRAFNGRLTIIEDNLQVKWIMDQSRFRFMPYAGL